MASRQRAGILSRFIHRTDRAIAEGSNTLASAINQVSPFVAKQEGRDVDDNEIIRTMRSGARSAKAGTSCRPTTSSKIELGVISSTSRPTPAKTRPDDLHQTTRFSGADDVCAKPRQEGSHGYATNGFSPSPIESIDTPAKYFDYREFGLPDHRTREDEELRAENIADLKEAFALFDRNGDGEISAKELTKVMRTVGMNPTENEIVEMMAELDVDGNGVIELPDFLEIMLKKVQNMDTEDEIRKVFQVFDKDHNGFINAEELRCMISHVSKEKMTEEDVDDLLKEADIDGDGRLDYEGNGVIELPDFLEIMLKKVQNMDTEDEIRKVFQVFDKDHNGFINAEELRCMIYHVSKEKMTEEDVDDFLKEADIDGDGRLDYEEFVRMLVNS